MNTNTETAAMISCYDDKKAYDMYCKKPVSYTHLDWKKRHEI